MCTSGPVPDREASGMITAKPLWKWRGCGKRGKPEAGFPRFPQPLGNLAQTARFPHSHSGGGPRWKSGKPKAGFPLFHPRSAITTPVCFSLNFSELTITYRKENTRRARKGTAWTPRFQAHSALESNVDFRLIAHWNQTSISGSFLDWKMLRLDMKYLANVP